MKIIIVGAGMIGFSLAEHFSRQNNHIVVVDRDFDLCERLKSKIDVFTVLGMGSSPAVLDSAHIAKADMLIAVTPSDETNLLACHFAKQRGVKMRIARIKSKDYIDADFVNIEELGVTNVIEPEAEDVDKILQFIDLPGVLETANFQNNSIYLRGYKITDDMPIANKTLLDLNELAKGAPMLVVLIIRNGVAVDITGSQIILPGDEIVVIMPKDSFSVFRSLINCKLRRLNKIVIAGNSLTAIRLAEAVKPMSRDVVFIDSVKNHAEEASSMLKGVDVFFGDSTDADVLHELNIEKADFFIAAGTDSEENVMASLIAKTAGAKRVIAIRNDTRNSELFFSLGIDHIVNPSEIALHMIIEKIQIAPIASYLQLKGLGIELLRLKVKPESQIIGQFLRDLDSFTKRSIVIGCIIRSGEVIIPWGGTSIEANDEVIILSKNDYIDWINKQIG